MTSIDLVQKIIEQLSIPVQANDDLSELQGNYYFQQTPQNSPLPSLQIDLKKTEKLNYQNDDADFQGHLQFTLVCPRSFSTQQIKNLQNTLAQRMDRKQLAITAKQFCFLWLESCNDIIVEHDRFSLSSIWQFRQS